MASNSHCCLSHSITVTVLCYNTTWFGIECLPLGPWLHFSCGNINPPDYCWGHIYEQICYSDKHAVRVENDGINQIVLTQICPKCNSLGEITCTEGFGAKCGEYDGSSTKMEHIPAKFIREAEHDLERDIWEDSYDAKVKCTTCCMQSKQEICDN